MTGRPSSTGRGERFSRTPKNDERWKVPWPSGSVFTFAGGHASEGLGHIRQAKVSRISKGPVYGGAAKGSPTFSWQRSGDTWGARQGSRRGICTRYNTVRRSFGSALSARIDSGFPSRKWRVSRRPAFAGGFGFRPEQNRFGSLRTARLEGHRLADGRPQG